MRVDAWMCDRCGRMVPDRGEEMPKGWLHAEVTTIGKADDPRELLACSEKCLALAIRPQSKPGPRPPAQPFRTGDGHRCPECGRTFALPQHLGLHRKKIHGVPSARDRREGTAT